MQQVWPSRDDGSGTARGPEVARDDLAADMSERTRWTALNFVAALDGAITINGRSGPLGGDGDRALFQALRDRCDVVLVGAGTARAENYGPPSDRAAVARCDRGQAARPALAIVTRSGELDDLDRLWAADDATVVVLTGTGMPARVRADLEARGAEVDIVGDGEAATIARVVDSLHARGWGRILCEGGPTLAHELLSAGLASDLFTTIAGVVVGGPPTMLPASLETPVDLELATVRISGEEVLVHHRVVGPRADRPTGE